MTWPLARRLDAAVANPGDPYLNSWILDWEYHAVAHGKPLFDAPIFVPARGTLAFSENLFGIALAGAPLRLIGLAPLTIHNILLLAGFAFTGFAAFLLTRRITGSIGAGIVSGIVAAFVPWHFTHLPHLQYAWTAWPAMMLVALFAFAEKPSVLRASLFGLAFLLNGLTNLHTFVFGSFAIVVAIAVLAFFHATLRTARSLSMLAAAIVLAGVLLTPVLLPYFRAIREYGMRGDVEETLHYSAAPGDWLRSNFHNRFYLPLNTNDGKTDPERWLFPGFASMALALVALYRPQRRDAVAVGIAWVVIGVIGAAGLRTPFHTFLFNYIPGFRGIRVPARWAIIAYAGVALLAGIGALRVARKRAWLFAPLLLIELHAAPIRYFVAPTQPSEVYRWLARTQPAAVLELPVAEKRSEYAYVLGQTHHHVPLLNGVSGFSPPSFERLRSSGDLIAQARSLGAQVLIVHADTLGSQEAPVKSMLRSHPLAYLGRFDTAVHGDYAFALTAARPSDDPQLTRFLAGERTVNRTQPMACLDTPSDEQIVNGPLRVMGWALARSGIRTVNLRFENGRVVVPADRCERADVAAAYPEFATQRMIGFVKDFPRRPKNISGATDLQVEVVDNDGNTQLLPDVWFIWRD